MNPRRVMVTIEMDTTAAIHDLEETHLWWHALQSVGYNWQVNIHHIQADIVKP